MTRRWPMAVLWGIGILGVVYGMPACSHTSSSSANGPTSAATNVPAPTSTPISVASLRGNAIVGHTGRARSSATWDQLRVGLHAYTGDDGGSATTLTVCSTLAAFLASIDDETTAHCLHVQRGVPIVIDAIIPSRSSDSDAGFHAPHVQIHALNGAWSGYTTVVPLQPAVPIGTMITLRREGNGTLQLAPHQGSDLGAGPDLGDQATLRVLAYDPKTADRPFRVAVIDGPHVGQTGWVFANDAGTQDGYSAYSLNYEFSSPPPTTDPLKRTYTLTSTLRVFVQVQTCKDAFHAMENQAAYKRLRSAFEEGTYHDFHAGDRLHIVRDPDPNDLWVIVSDDGGNQGCASRYNLPGY